VERLDDLDDEPDDRVRGEELAAEATLGHGQVREEVLVDEPERVAGQLARQRREQPQQLDERRLLEPLIALREHVPQLGVVGLDEPHGGVDRGAEVLLLGKAHKAGEVGLLGDEQN
jgi:hypothetical protein